MDVQGKQIFVPNKINTETKECKYVDEHILGDLFGKTLIWNVDIYPSFGIKSSFVI